MRGLCGAGRGGGAVRLLRLPERARCLGLGAAAARRRPRLGEGRAQADAGGGALRPAAAPQALEQLRTAVLQRQPWAPLQGRRDIAAMALALAPEFGGDRVAAFIHATADMIITAHGGKTEFFLLDGMDAALRDGRWVPDIDSESRRVSLLPDTEPQAWEDLMRQPAYLQALDLLP